MSIILRGRSGFSNELTHSNSILREEVVIQFLTLRITFVWCKTSLPESVCICFLFDAIPMYWGCILFSRWQMPSLHVYIVLGETNEPDTFCSFPFRTLITPWSICRGNPEIWRQKSYEDVFKTFGCAINSPQIALPTQILKAFAGRSCGSMMGNDDSVI